MFGGGKSLPDWVTGGGGGGSRPNFQTATSASEETVDKKFTSINTMLEQKKEALFMNEVMAEKYWQLKSNSRGRRSEEELQQMAMQLTEEEKATVKRRVDEDMQRLKKATRDAVEFKRYFFDELVPIMQENTDFLLRQQRFNPKDRELALKDTMREWQNTKNLTIKLLLSNINDPSTGFLTRWISQQVANATTTYGLNHAALQIGPYIVDWTTSQIVMPRIFKAKKVVLLIPINETCIVPRSEDVLFRISEFIVEWNTQYKYHRTKNSIKNRLGNCQFFVERLLDELGIKPSWQKNGPIEQYIEKIKENAINGDALVVWDKSGTPHEFKNHDELVQFYKTQVEGMTDFRTREEMEHILKSIERCMMFRFWATNDAKYRVEHPLFNKKFKKRQSDAKSRMYRNVGPEDPESEDEEDEDLEPQPVTGMLNFNI